MESFVAEIGTIRDRFAETLRQGGSADITPWLDPLQGSQRAALFRLLLSVVIQNSGPTDSAVARTALIDKFAEYRPIIDELFESGDDPEATRSYLVECSSTEIKRGNADTDGLAHEPQWTESEGRYCILEEVARGGMGAVLRAHDRELDRPVALKVILPGARQIPHAVQRFRQEACITGQLQHPGIPRNF